MKLTKGKISKLYNKKKQTFKKKVNKKKTSNKRRTFRRKHGLYLSRKSLKNIFNKKYKGDAKVEELPKAEEHTGVAEPIKQEPVTQEHNDVGNANKTHNVEEPMPVPLEPVPVPLEPEPVAVPVAEPVAEPVAQEPVAEPVPVTEPVAETVPIAEPETVTPETVTPETVTPETVTPETVTPETVTPETVTEVKPETVTPEPITPETVTPEPITPEPITPEPMKPNDPELSQAVETVVKYFSDAIANSVEKKVAEKLEQNSSNSDTMQNGFDSLNQEVNKMATGGKKTRRFKLTNKNKSIQKHHK